MLFFSEHVSTRLCHSFQEGAFRTFVALHWSGHRHETRASQCPRRENEAEVRQRHDFRRWRRGEMRYEVVGITVVFQHDHRRFWLSARGNKKAGGLHYFFQLGHSLRGLDLPILQTATFIIPNHHLRLKSDTRRKVTLLCHSNSIGASHPSHAQPLASYAMRLRVRSGADWQNVGKPSLPR